MAKRTSPKLHNDRDWLHMMAYHFAASEAAIAMLRSLYLADKAETVEGRDAHWDRAAEYATHLLDYVELRRRLGGSVVDGPSYFIDEAIGDRRQDFEPHRDHALQIIATMATTPARRAA